MENNINGALSGSPYTTLNHPAFDTEARPLPPVIEAPSGVQQVSTASSPFPPLVQDLLSANPRERVRMIAKSTQQDAYFASLAQNLDLDEKSRLVAAMKIQDPEKRDAVLSELVNPEDPLLEAARVAQDRLRDATKLFPGSKREEALWDLVHDRNLDPQFRFEAAKTLAPGFQRETVLRDLANKEGLDPSHRIAAAKMISSEGYVQETLRALAYNLPLDYRVAASTYLISADNRNAALLPLAYNEKLEIKLRLEALTMITPGPRRDEALRVLVSTVIALPQWNEREELLCKLAQDRNVKVEDRIAAAKAMTPGATREKVLMEFAQDGSLEASYRIEAADDLGNNTREEALAQLAQDRRLDQKLRWKALQMLPEGPKCEETLEALVRDYTFGDYRVSAVKAMKTRDKKEAVSYALSMEDNLDEHYRRSLAKDLLPGDNRENALQKIAQDRYVSGGYRVSAANAMAPGDKREEALLALAKESRLDFKDRWEATKGLSVKEKKQEALLAVAEDRMLESKDRIQAAKALGDEALRKTLLADIAND